MVFYGIFSCKKHMFILHYYVKRMGLVAELIKKRRCRVSKMFGLKKGKESSKRSSFLQCVLSPSSELRDFAFFYFCFFILILDTSRLRWQ